MSLKNDIDEAELMVMIVNNNLVVLKDILKRIKSNEGSA